MDRELTHHARPDNSAIVDFFYGNRRIAELRWSAREQDRASCDVSWDLVMIHFTGEEDWDAGMTACGDQQAPARLIFGRDHGPAWQRQADRVRDETRDQAIGKAIAEIRERIEHDVYLGLEPFPEFNHIA
jgi:hypothetical protein